MAVLEDVRGMQQQGMNDEQIVQALREHGTPYREIADALAQTRIKAAVEQPESEPQLPYPDSSSIATPYPSSGQNDNMQPSMMSQEPPEEPHTQEYYPPAPGQPAYEVPQPGQYSPNYEYSQAQSYSQGSVSADLMTEIAEQVITEKLSEVRKHLEKVVDLKTLVESKLESLDERLKRLEKTIDTLQSSVLRKVGDYVTNVQDIKTELIETQKTFSKLLPEVRRQPVHHEHQHSQHSHKTENHQHHEHKK